MWAIFEPTLVVAIGETTELQTNMSLTVSLRAKVINLDTFLTHFKCDYFEYLHIIATSDF